MIYENLYFDFFPSLKKSCFKVILYPLYYYFLFSCFLFFYQIPGAPEEEAVRIFVEFQRMESAIKGNNQSIYGFFYRCL